MFKSLKKTKKQKKTHTHTKGGIQCLYALVILSDLMKYYLMKNILKCF